MTRKTRLFSGLLLLSVLSTTAAHAQALSPPNTPSVPSTSAPDTPTVTSSSDDDGTGSTARSSGWRNATNALAITSVAIELLMPRVFYSDPEVTVGWKARWHLSVLAPLMTLTTLALFNEQVLKDAFSGARPGCGGAAAGTPGCGSYGFLSTPSFLASSALGHGASVFLVDTLKWSGGRVNVGALLGDIVAPLILAPITIVGRTEGNLETGGQAWGSAAIGLVTGLATGLLYAEMQRPECGYSGSLFCW